jgi:hypothetical protein
MTQEDYLKRRIFLKRQHVSIIKDEISELEKQLNELSKSGNAPGPIGAALVEGNAS